MGKVDEVALVRSCEKAKEGHAANAAAKRPAKYPHPRDACVHRNSDSLSAPLCSTRNSVGHCPRDSNARKQNPSPKPDLYISLKRPYVGTAVQVQEQQATHAPKVAPPAKCSVQKGSTADEEPLFPTTELL